jgi:hypothetical protein
MDMLALRSMVKLLQYFVAGETDAVILRDN